MRLEPLELWRKRRGWRDDDVHLRLSRKGSPVIITPDLERLIGLIAEAKMRLMVTGAARGTPDFAQNLAQLDRVTKAARSAFDTFLAEHDGKGPRHLYIQLRACELGVAKLGIKEP